MLFAVGEGDGVDLRVMESQKINQGLSIQGGDRGVGDNQSGRA